MDSAILNGRVHTRPTTAKDIKFNGRASSTVRGNSQARRPQHLPRSTAEMATATVAKVPPAVLPDTPKDFPIPPEKLIELAKKVFLETDIGQKDPDVLDPNFRFEFPIVKLDKQKYLDAVGTFDFKAGIPNFENNVYDWRVDKYEPHRVWFTVRHSGTHAGTLKVFKFKYEATGKPVLGAPECLSLTFNEAGKVTSFTGGYVMDNRVGNTNKLGALFGILSAVGVFVPHPQPGTLGWKVGSAVDTFINLLGKLLSFLTFGLIKKQKSL